METITVSDCCNAEDVAYEDCSASDMGICPECKDFCVYEERCVECNEAIEDCECDG